MLKPSDAKFETIEELRARSAITPDIEAEIDRQLAEPWLFGEESRTVEYGGSGDWSRADQYGYRLQSSYEEENRHRRVAAVYARLGWVVSNVVFARNFDCTQWFVRLEFRRPKDSTNV